MIVLSPTAADREALERVMSGIDRESLMDDGGKYGDVVIAKPWGNEKELRCTEAFSIWLLEISPGHETSMHCHSRKTAILEVQRRHVVFRTLADQVVLCAGQCVLIEPGVFHQISAPAGAWVSEVEFPPNRRDLLRLSDRYGRELKGYERAHA